MDIKMNRFMDLTTSDVMKRKVVDASGGMCEALMELGNGLHTRCWAGPVDVHHRLTRGRGGAILDQVSETYHLMALCRKHHGVAHDEASAFDNGLLIAGRVVVENGLVVYTGPDEYLSSKY